MTRALPSRIEDRLERVARSHPRWVVARFARTWADLQTERHQHNHTKGVLATTDADRWRLDSLYQQALRNTADWKWEEFEDKMDARLNETVRIAVKAIPPGEHDSMLKQLMAAQRKIERLQDELRISRRELLAKESKCDTCPSRQF